MYFFVRRGRSVSGVIHVVVQFTAFVHSTSNGAVISNIYHAGPFCLIQALVNKTNSSFTDLQLVFCLFVIITVSESGSKKGNFLKRLNYVAINVKPRPNRNNNLKSA